MSFSRSHLFSAVQWDVDNLEFGVFVPDPKQFYGDGTDNVYFEGHNVPDGFAYLSRDSIYESIDATLNAGTSDLYDYSTGNAMPPSLVPNPGFMGVYVVFNTEDGNFYAPMVGGHGGDAAPGLEYTDSSTADEIKFGEYGSAIGVMATAAITSVKISNEVVDRMESVGGSGDTVFSSDKTLGLVQSYTTKHHKISPGFTWTEADENSALRAHLMWAPYKQVPTEHLGAGYYVTPYKGFVRVFTAIPIAPPLRDYRGFYSKNSDFHHLITYRMYGVHEDTHGPTPRTYLHPIRDGGVEGIQASMNVPTALLGNNPPKLFDVNIPSNATYNNFINFLQPDADQINAARNPLGQVIRPYYGGVPWSTFMISYGFSYNVLDQSWYTFDGLFSNQFACHPRNPYAGSFRGGSPDDVPKIVGGSLYQSDPELDTYPAEYRRNDLMSNDSRLFYKYQVGNFLAAGHGHSPNENRYDVSFVKSGRLGSANSMLRDKASTEGFEGKQYLKYKNTKVVDADSKYVMYHKLFSPRPFNGEEIRVNQPFDGFSEVFMTHDDLDWPDITVPVGSDKYESLESNFQTMARYHESSMESSQMFRMWWSELIEDSAAAEAVATRDRAVKLVYFGNAELQMASAFFQIGQFVMKLNKMWTYDDTPKEARIRMQKNRQLNSNMFTSITDKSLDIQMEDEYTEFLGRQLLRDRTLSLGGTFTERQVREAEAAMGVESGTYDSRIGTATELGSGRGDY